MARHRDDDTVRPDETSPQGAAIDDDPILDRPDPLGLGGTPPPDAPSRRARPRIVALLVEFFRMSRTTAILLGAFVLAGALYLFVRDEPVVAFRPQPERESTGTSEPAEPVDPSSTPTDQTTDTTAPTSSSPPIPTGTGSRTTGTTSPGGTATTGPDADRLPGGAEQQPPQQQQQSPQQSPQQQSQPQWQQEAPGAGEASVPGGALEG